MQLIEPPLSPAHRLVRDLPRDQALGLRLLALARAAAAVHLAEVAHPDRPDQDTPTRAEPRP